MLLDVKTDFGQGYSPGDYDGMERGPVSIRQALGNSINIPAVKTLALVGVNKAVETANDLGIMSLNDPDRYGLSLVLGGGEVTLLELTSAYGVFATGGIYHEPVAVLRVEDKRGKILQEWKESSGKKVLDSQVAYLINNILSDDEARAMVFGLGSSLTLPGRVVAAKTGTTDGYRDGWTVGYTPSLVAGAWVGNNDNSSMNRAGGSMGAAPIWNRYMKVALKGVENEAFEEPPGITRVTVDRLSGKLPTDATPDTKTEVFSSFGVPKEKDDVHVKVRVVSLAPDKLPPANFPSELTEERIFTVLHSERPDYSNWENPVIAWAKANGYNNVPTETYGGSVEIGGSDRVKITSPQNGAVIKGSFEVRVEPQEGELEKVELYLDGKLKGTLVSSPYLFSLIPELDGEIHHLLAKGYAGGSSYQYKIYLTFGERVGPSSRYLSLGYPTETKFPLTLKINLTAEGEKLSLVNFRYFLDSSLVSTTTAREIKIDSGSSGQHEAFVKMITQDGQVIISSPIRFNTK